MYECFHCGHRSVVWDSDYDFSDYGYEGKGIVHACHCAHCGAEIEYRVKTESDEDDDGEPIDDGYSSNMYCDNSGYCGGTSCPNYYKCHDTKEGG